MRSLISKLGSNVVNWYFAQDERRAERLADRDYMRLFYAAMTALGASLGLRWFTHLEFLSGIFLGVGITLAVGADAARRLGLTNGAWKVKARS